MRALREALLKLGLSEREIQQFLTILKSELPDCSPDEETIRLICDRFVKDLGGANRGPTEDKMLSWRMAKIVSGGLALGVLGNLIYDLMKAGVTEDSPDESPLIFPGGWTPIKKVPRDDPRTGQEVELPRVMTGLEKVREALDLPVEDMAKACGVSRRTYLKAERGDPLSLPVSRRITIGIDRLARKRGLFIGQSERQGTLPPGKTWP